MLARGVAPDDPQLSYIRFCATIVGCLIGAHLAHRSIKGMMTCPHMEHEYSGTYMHSPIASVIIMGRLIMDYVIQSVN